MFNLDKAREEGYSDQEIADHLAGKLGFDAAAARNSGYTDTELADFLSKKPEAKPSSDVAASSAPVSTSPVGTEQYLRSKGIEPEPPIQSDIVSKDVPEIGAAPELNEASWPAFTASLGLLYAGDTGSAKGILDKQFPGVEFSISTDGEELVILPSGTYRVRGLAQEIASAGTKMLSFFPAIRGATTVAAGKGMLSKMGAQSAGAGATQTGIEATETALGGEFTPGEIPVAAAFGAAGELISPMVKAYKEVRKAKEMDVGKKELVEKVLPTEARAEEAVAGLKEATGVEVGLFRAQKTLTPSELYKQRILTQLDASSRKAADALSTENKQVFDATTTLIDRLTPSGMAVGAEKRIRDAAKEFDSILDFNRSQAFDEAFSPALQKAADSNLKVPVDETISLINGIKGGHRKGSPIHKLMDEIINGLNEADRTIVDGTNLGALHNYKREISQKVAGFEKRTGPLDRELKRDVSRIYDSITTTLRNNSDDYNNAMEVFISRTPEIEAYQASLVGRVKDLTDSELLGVTAKIFDRRVSANEVAQAKKIIESVDPDAWTAIVAKEIDNRVGGIVEKAKEQGADFVKNTPGNIKSAIFGNDKQRRVLYRALNDDQKKNFRYLETVLERAAAGRSAGSPTATFTEIIKNLRGRLGVLKDVFTRPLQVLQETGDSSFFDRKVSALADAAFDPKWSSRFNEIREAKPSEAAKAMLQLLNDIDEEED